MCALRSRSVCPETSNSCLTFHKELRGAPPTNAPLNRRQDPAPDHVLPISGPHRRAGNVASFVGNLPTKQNEKAHLVSMSSRPDGLRKMAFLFLRFFQAKDRNKKSVSSHVISDLFKGIQSPDADFVLSNGRILDNLPSLVKHEIRRSKKNHTPFGFRATLCARHSG